MTPAQKSLIQRKLFQVGFHLTKEEVETLGTTDWSSAEASVIIQDIYDMTAPCDTDEEKARRDIVIKSFRLILQKH